MYIKGAFGNIFVLKNPGLNPLNSYISVKSTTLDLVKKVMKLLPPNSKAKFNINDIIYYLPMTESLRMQVLSISFD